MVQLCFSHSTCCTTKHHREGCSFPFVPRCDWQVHDSLLLVESGSLDLTRQDNSSACLSNSDSCLSCRKLCLSQRGENRRAACGLQIILGYSLTFLSLPFTEVSNYNNHSASTHTGTVTGVLAKQVWCSSE